MLPQFLWQRFRTVLKKHTLLPEQRLHPAYSPASPVQTQPYDCFSQWNMNEGSYVTARSGPQNTSQVLLPARCSRQLGPWGWGSHKMVGTQDVEESHTTNLNTHSGLLHKKETAHSLSYHILGGSTCYQFGLSELIHPTQQITILYYIILSYFLFNS